LAASGAVAGVTKFFSIKSSSQSLTVGAVSRVAAP